KAISVEKNEDFLGEVRLDFAEILINEEYPEHAFVELETYRKHRETKGRHSDRYELLKTKAKTTTRTDNREFFAEFIEYAEELAFSDIPWTEVVLTDRWKNEKGKERFNFNNGINLNVVTGRARFPILKKAKLGTIF